MMKAQAKTAANPAYWKPVNADFFNRVYAVVRCVPIGRITTYGAIAAFLGATGAARMVGYALNAVHSAAPDVPAHRVVNRRGMLTGKIHFGSPTRMQALLEAEGVEIIQDKVVKFEALFWDPATHIDDDMLQIALFGS